MGAVIRLVNGSRAKAREHRERARARESSKASRAKVSQRYIFGGIPYDGAYEVTPTDYEQYLATENKTLKRDVTVHKVPYYETSNESGGYTVSILS